MLTKLTVRNFKRFDDVEIELGNPVVFIGPNNSGKTTALQALALWEIGLRRWNEARGGRSTPTQRPGVTINRRDLIAVPVPDANLLWRDLHVRDVRRVKGKQDTQNIRVEITVEGVTADRAWVCGLEFDYANDASIYCRPLQSRENGKQIRMPIPEEAKRVKVALLPPMSGLRSNEDRLDRGAINVRIGEGRTADVLRNLCYLVATTEGDDANWNQLCRHIEELFGVKLITPKFIQERGEIVMSYEERGGPKLDISSSGRGLQQTLLLLAYLYSNPGAVLLLDEPDAHLEILRQRQTYQLLTKVASEQGCQIIAASHSEVVLNEAADRDVMVSFVGKPHRVNDRGSQTLKALKDIGFEHYSLAEQKGWVLYLEGSTDLAIIQAFADTLMHQAAKFLEQPFVHYVANQPEQARKHFYGLLEAKPDLKGIAILDNLDKPEQLGTPLLELYWSRNEIENYLFYPQVLLTYAKGEQPGDLFALAESANREKVMQECINDFVIQAALRNPNDPWWITTKASDVLERIFDKYFEKLSLPNLMRKSGYHQLASIVPKHSIANEIEVKLSHIVAIAKAANPVT